MALKISNETKVGVLAVVALTILILGYNFLKGRDLFSKEVTLYAQYESIDGLQVANSVLLKGMKVGQITDMNLINNGNDGILVRFIVKNDLKIPVNTTAIVTSADILGTKAIELRLGNSQIWVKDHDTLISESQESLASQVTSQILPVKIKAESLLASMDTVLILVQSIFNKETRENIQGGVMNINETLDNINKISAKMDIMVGTRLDGIMTNVESITGNVARMNDSLSQIVDNATLITSAVANSRFAEAINSAETSMIQLSEIMQKIERGEGSLGLLVNDNQLYYNLSNSAKELDKVLKEFQNNPNKYLSPLGKNEKQVEKMNRKAE